MMNRMERFITLSQERDGLELAVGVINEKLMAVNQELLVLSDELIVDLPVVDDKPWEDEGGMVLVATEAGEDQYPGVEPISDLVEAA